jgi:hypothetical protein
VPCASGPVRTDGVNVLTLGCFNKNKISPLQSFVPLMLFHRLLMDHTTKLRIQIPTCMPLNLILPSFHSYNNYTHLPSDVQLKEILILTKKKHTRHASFNMQLQGKVNQNDINLRWWKVS